MKTFYFPIALTIGGGILYHLSQKSVPQQLNPFFALIIAYATGIMVCLLCAFLYSADQPFLSSWKDANWALLGIGMGAAAIEIGFLLAYRAGWDISVAAVLANVTVALALVVLGVVVFKESLTIWNILGIACCMLGLVLISKK